MSYNRADVQNAADIIKRDCPTAIVEMFDFDYGLRVLHPSKSKEAIVFQPARPRIGQPQVITPLPEVLDWLKQP